MSIELRIMQLPPQIQDPLVDLALRIVPLDKLPHMKMLVEFFASLGADRQEVKTALKGIRSIEDWTPRWRKTAQGVASSAEAALAAGHNETAREAFLRASLYYAMVDRLVFDLNEKKTTYGDVIESHDKFRELAEGIIEKVKIPSPDGEIYGFFRKPEKVKNPPCVIIVQGGDTIKEILSVWEEAFLSRGIATLNIDQPGNGETRLNGLALEEVSILKNCAVAVLDYLEKRPEIDSSRVGIFGFSWGGFVAPYMTAHEPRIKACAVMSASYEIIWGGGDPARWLKPYRDTFMFISGSRKIDQLRVKLPEVTLDGVAVNIRCPILIIHGEKDGLFPVDMARRLASEVSGPKEVKILEGADHGCTQYLNTTALPMFADWLGDTLERGR